MREIRGSSSLGITVARLSQTSILQRHWEKVQWPCVRGKLGFVPPSLLPRPAYFVDCEGGGAFSHPVDIFLNSLEAAWIRRDCDGSRARPDVQCLQMRRCQFMQWEIISTGWRMWIWWRGAASRPWMATCGKCSLEYAYITRFQSV